MDPGFTLQAWPRWLQTSPHFRLTNSRTRRVLAVLLHEHVGGAVDVEGGEGFGGGGHGGG